MEGVATYAHDAQMADTAPAGARTRILLIDDEPTILSFVSRILRGHGSRWTARRTAPRGSR